MDRLGFLLISTAMLVLTLVLPVWLSHIMNTDEEMHRGDVQCDPQDFFGASCAGDRDKSYPNSAREHRLVDGEGMPCA